VTEHLGHGWAWAFYLAGAVLTLGWKLVRYLRHEKKNGVPAREAFAEWVLEDSVENTVSWTTTVGFVWVFGVVYIERIGFLDFINVVPVHNSIAFFFGGLMELVAPQVAKQLCSWVMAHLPGGGSGP